MKLKITAVLLTAILLLGLLSACGHEHVWSEATCTAPKTCTECGETDGGTLAHSFSEPTCVVPATCSVCGETDGGAPGHTFSEATCTEPSACTVCGETDGDPLEHNYMDATCTEPATCTFCGTTEGQALGHQAGEATYWSAALCEVCGETVSEALQADFEKYGIRADLQPGTEYRYNTVTGDGSSATYGTTVITSHEVMTSDDLRPALDGYNWHVVTFTTVFTDPVIQQRGMLVDYTVTDYYNIAAFADHADHSDESMSVYKVSINGEEKQIRFGQSGGFTGNDDGSVTFTLTLSAQIPEGYDGVVIGLNSGLVDARIDNYLFEVYEEDAFLLYRIFG